MSNRLRSSLVAASLLAGLCLPVSAQTAVPPTSLPAVPAPAAAPLTLQECVQRALQHGFDLEIQRYNPAMAKDAVDVARGGFYPTLSFNGSQSHSDTGPLGGTAGTQSDARDTRLAATDLLQTGTTVNVSTDLNRSKTNPPLLTSFYNPVYNSDLTVAITQPPPARRRHRGDDGDAQPGEDRPDPRRLRLPGPGAQYCAADGGRLLQLGLCPGTASGLPGFA